ncbi:MAG TPA: pitrilysin family protein [Pyrinomonadaceae bacterium]
MKLRTLFRNLSLVTMCLVFLAAGAHAQRPGSGVPRQEKLLNGLKVLMWSDPAASDVKVSIRVHSGSAFDPQGKEGVMKLLAENIFPTPVSRSFFSEDLNGNLEVISNYDYIQINASGKASEFLTLFETLAEAVSNPTIDKETTAALKKSLTEQLVRLEKDPDYIAEHAALKRLFGTFPYGRPQMGSVESLERIDFADLLFAKERFLSADNATVAITGNFNTDLAFRAARRYFGAWLKSEKRVPPTFRQPDAPDARPLEMVVQGASPQSSFVLRGVARNDPDYFASMVLADILKDRSTKIPGVRSIAHHARVLPGFVMVNFSGSTGFPFNLLGDRITDAEFSRARSQVAADFGKRSLMDQWLDVDTYRTTVAGDNLALQNLTVADVQRLAGRLAKNPIASVLIRPATSAQ